jgi:hypothetical protein
LLYYDNISAVVVDNLFKGDGFSMFRNVILLACLAVILILGVACGSNLPSEVPVDSESVAEVEPATSVQNVLTVQQARELLADVFSGNATITYRAMQDKTESDVRFYAFEVDDPTDSGIYALAWVNSITGAVDVEEVEEVKGEEVEDEEMPTVEKLTVEEALALVAEVRSFEGQAEIHHQDSKWEGDVEVYHFEIHWYGDSLTYDSILVNSITGAMDIEEIEHEWAQDMLDTTTVTQVSPMEARRTEFERKLVGTWAVSAADNEWFLGMAMDPVTFYADGTGLQGTTDFRWHVDIVERPHLPDGDYLVLVLYIPEFDATEEYYFPEIYDYYLVLSDYTGMEWSELIRQ